MRKAPLGNVGGDASPAHQASRTPAQVVERPALHATGFVKRRLELAKSAYRRRSAISREQKASGVAKLGQDRIS